MSETLPLRNAGIFKVSKHFKCLKTHCQQTGKNTKQKRSEADRWDDDKSNRKNASEDDGNGDDI
jgi:hypothetical protein